VVKSETCPDLGFENAEHIKNQSIFQEKRSKNVTLKILDGKFFKKQGCRAGNPADGQPTFGHEVHLQNSVSSPKKQWYEFTSCFSIISNTKGITQVNIHQHIHPQLQVLHSINVQEPTTR
jgi:hypothetical protein